MFNSKERTPILICFEVVCEGEKCVIAKRRKNTSWLEHIRRSLTSVVEDREASFVFKSDEQNHIDGTADPMNKQLQLGQWGSPTDKEKLFRRSISNRNFDIENNNNDMKDINETDNEYTSVVFKEKWEMKENRIRSKSPIGHLEGYRLIPIIIKR